MKKGWYLPIQYWPGKYLVIFKVTGDGIYIYLIDAGSRIMLDLISDTLLSLLIEDKNNG